MHRRQNELMRAGLKNWPDLSSELRSDDEPKVQTYYLMYHCLDEKDQQVKEKEAEGKYNFSPERIIELLKALKAYGDPDVALLIVSHSSKAPKTVLSELDDALKDIVFSDQRLRPRVLDHTAILPVKYFYANIDDILEFSKDDYYLSILSTEEIIVFHEKEPAFRKHHSGDEMHYTFGQILGFSLEEVYMAYTLLNVMYRETAIVDWVLSILDSRFMQSIVRSVALNTKSEIRLLFLSSMRSEIVTNILSLYHKDDRSRYLDMTYDVYYTFYGENDENNPLL